MARRKKSDPFEDTDDGVPWAETGVDWEQWKANNGVVIDPVLLAREQRKAAKIAERARAEGR